MERNDKKWWESDDNDEADVDIRSDTKLLKQQNKQIKKKRP